jgi:hypothetical protein
MKLSSGFVTNLCRSGGYWKNIANGVMKLYSGAEPATADAQATGTLLATLTLSGAAWTPEVLAEYAGTITGASGTITSVKVGGLEILGSTVTFLTDVTTTAALVAAKINDHSSVTQFVARSSAGVVYVKCPPTSGTAYAAITIVTAVSGGDVAFTVASSGLPNGSNGTTLGVAAVNGLNFQFPAVAGVFTKETTVWEDTSADAAGTVGYARLTLDGADDFTLSTLYRRIQFSVGVSGADITSQILTTTLTAPVVLNTFALTATTAPPA